MTAITGGAGFIGAHLVSLLGDVRIIDIASPPTVSVGTFVRIDITDRAAVFDALRGVTHLYHLAADPNLWEPRRGHFHRVNFLGTVNVLDAAAHHKIRRVVHCSTESILTRVRQSTPIREDQDVPLKEVIGPYCRSKYFAERYAHQCGAIVVNPTLPVGPGDRGCSPPTRMMRDFLTHGRSAYVDADLNLIDVRDVALGLKRAMEVGEPGRRYLLGAENWSVKRVFDFLAELTGKPKPKWKVPYTVALMAAYASEFIADVVTGKSPAATITGVKLAGRRMQFDASESLAVLGLTPRPVAEAICSFVKSTSNGVRIPHGDSGRKTGESREVTDIKSQNVRNKMDVANSN